MMKMSMFSCVLSLLVFAYQPSYASLVAVIDSGVDLKHTDLKSNAWLNDREILGNGVDDDGNGFVDDIHGWNFADDDSDVIDYKFLGTFSRNVYQFFDIQQKMLQSTASSSEILWLRSQMMDVNFKAQIGTFANFVHGTHVSGIAVKDTPKAKVLAVKLISTEVKVSDGSSDGPVSDEQVRKIVALFGGDEEAAFKFFVNQVARSQMKQMTKIVEYVHNQGAKVANGSFGTGFAQANALISPTYKKFFGRAGSEDEINTWCNSFLNALITEGKKAVAAAPETLFVFASGNEGSDNDETPTSPSSIEAPNVISVGATNGVSELAKFSNYGAQSVHVTAPGVGIRSAIPGNEYMLLSGTSQAAPYVAQVASAMKDINPKLTPAQMKKILIETSDVKSFLRGKVVSSGVVNRERALHAAKLSLRESLLSAISSSLTEVANVSYDDKGFESLGPVDQRYYDFVLPLPSDLIVK